MANWSSSRKQTPVARGKRAAHRPMRLRNRNRVEGRCYGLPGAHSVLRRRARPTRGTGCSRWGWGGCPPMTNGLGCHGSYPTRVGARGYGVSNWARRGCDLLPNWIAVVRNELLIPCLDPWSLFEKKKKKNNKKGRKKNKTSNSGSSWETKPILRI